MPVVYVPERESFREEKLSKVSLFSVPQFFLDLYCLEPGQDQKPHAHEGAAKYYYVLEGEGLFQVDGQEQRLGPGHAVLSKPGEVHGVRNPGPARLKLLVCMGPNPGSGHS